MAILTRARAARTSEHNLEPDVEHGTRRSPVDGLRRRLARALTPRTLVLGLVAAVVAYLALVPVVTMFVASLQSAFLFKGSTWTLQNYVDTFTSATFYRLLVNSIGYAFGTAIIALVIGFGLAWLFARTNTPFKSFAVLTALVPLVIPGILNTVSWLLLLNPRTGILNVLLSSLGLPQFDVYSLGGMILIQSIHVAPIAFIMGVAAFSSLDSTLEEAALASGASTFKVVRGVTLRLARPAIFSAGLLIFIQTISSFEVPQLVGVPAHVFVFVSLIYASVQSFPPGYGAAGALGMTVLVIAAGCVLVANLIARGTRYQTITGKGYRPRPLDLGPWKWAGAAVFGLFFVIAVVLPLGVLLYSSLLPVYQAPSWDVVQKFTLANYRNIWQYPVILGSLVNSLVVSVSAGVIVMVLTAIVSYITLKTRIPGRALLDVLASLPIAVPSILMGIGLLFWYLVLPVVHLYGTLLLLIVAFVTIAIPYGIRYTSSGIIQIKDELEEAAAISGASWLTTFRRVYVPLLMPSLLAGFLYTVIVSFREISAAVFLYSQGTEVVAVEIYNLWSDGYYELVAPLGIVMVVSLMILVAIVQRLGGNLGITGQQVSPGAATAGPEAPRGKGRAP